jgi:hypothetical protein
MAQGLSGWGGQIKTAFGERLNLDLRQRGAAVGRRVKTRGQGEDGWHQHLVVFQRSQHFALPHASLRPPW